MVDIVKKYCGVNDSSLYAIGSNERNFRVVRLFRYQAMTAYSLR